MKTVDEFEMAAVLADSPLRECMLFEGSKGAHVVISMRRPYRPLCGNLPGCTYIPSGDEPMCVQCMQAWETAEAIDNVVGAVRPHSFRASIFDPQGIHDRPCATPGLLSYRYRGRYEWVMIGARNFDDAMSEVARSTDEPIDKARLQVWDGRRYV